ncbi:hypothetical protein LEP1GSC121_0311 [Leptospira borgpetersenii serovar Castellonis str. 200801910]|uniref:Uncharacterized protein n=1 Tax=Leptospira borgpetersenii serovar Ballum TaxID=280505 RepID=A0A0S2IL68_LEPBO|nr:hypothetical protein LBBP_00044 [Leptospira borgpetersenii serovar Ballum]EKR01629.1 hypothetical protein LEP1GSC121_0311 [Leptospira borgpetersenii serovar Castellonis str. 200801910]
MALFLVESAVRINPCEHMELMSKFFGLISFPRINRIWYYGPL